MKNDNKKIGDESNSDEFEQWLLASIKKIMSEANPEKLNEKLSNPELFTQEITKAFDKGIASAIIGINDEIKAKAQKTLSENRSHAQGFQTRLYDIWGDAIDQLELLMYLAVESGENFNKKYRPIAVREKDYVFEVLIRLHARACLVTSEVITLLKSGHAEAAYSRWRTLHETNTTAWFVFENGAEIAERYLLHDVIESYKAAIQYQEVFELHKDFYASRDFKPIPMEEVDELRRQRDFLCVRFGQQYAQNYGWALPALENKKPSFSDIEKAVDFSYLRPFYKLASHGVHAQPKSVLFNLGRPSNKNVMLAGPSIFGLADPGYSTAISLHQTTHALLMSKRSLDAILMTATMKSMVDDITEKFMDTHDQITLKNSQS